ncbi:hypothetical protein Cob_v007591 [Colletotrichum orbiculare MAFF 240422]|uniref:Uncharacterized protein n=1 Tax=Colletotrichum orbiculare (strain 104-T / ATCC 96160 / CBS 514.97 / LARS 414 / MAFF 240422) TaxID=1213857 RepID=A0A484FMF7_COLOR|nr:hypothetical protein Cob_v007591 [Colletotrichum orbiculare MAFF 240422]
MSLSSLFNREEPADATADPGSSGSSGGGGMTLPLLLAIAIGGGVLLFICLAFLLIALAGRRHRAKTASLTTTSGSPQLGTECSGSPRTPSPRPRRLTKPRPKGGAAYVDMVEVHEQQPHRSLASIIGVPRSKTFSIFGTPAEGAGGQQRGGHLRRNNSWIDEDAIHGPRVQRDERRLSIRDSFILRTPTLPDVLNFKEDEAFGENTFRNEMLFPVQPPRPVSMPAHPGQPPRIPLPRTASYELAERLAAAARGGVVSASPQGPQGPRPVPLQRLLRHKTTESDLAEILRSTEERLQNGTPSNSRPATRQRATSTSAGSSVQTPRGSPTKAGSPIKVAGSPVKHGSPMKNHSPVRFEGPEKNMVFSHVGQAMVPLAQQRARTPSPHKRLGAVPLLQTPTHHHKRNTSQSSAASDGDSLFGETTPEIDHILPTGLSSPSRRSDHESPGNERPEDRCMSMGSLGSSASSSLSTLYSVNEPEDDAKTGGEGAVRGRKPKGLIIDTQMCDPFVTPPEVPPRSPKRQSSSLPPLRRATPPEQLLDIEMEAPFNSKSATNSPIPRPLDVVKRSSLAEKNQTRYSIMMHSPSLAGSPEAIRPRSVMSQKPVFLVSSNSVTSMKASPGTSPEDNSRPAMPDKRTTFGQRVNVYPPPLSLRPAQGSPNREALVMGSPDGVVSVLGGNASPTIRPVRPSPASSPSSPTRRPLPSPDLVDRRGSPTPGRQRRRGMASPIRERAASRQPANQRDNKIFSSSDIPAIVLKPANSPKRNSFHRDFAVMGLQSTVAQLRRMNSQMSTLSAGSSLSDPESPTLPNMRGGGFSPDRSNSRVSKIGRQNYLSMGTSPQGNRNTRASIKAARNSIAVIKGRPGGGTKMENLEAAAAGEGNGSRVIRGPRPLNPTPRSAGRGSRNGDVESPTRRGKGEGLRVIQNEAHDSATSLSTYDDGGQRQSQVLAAGAHRSSSNLRL